MGVELCVRGGEHPTPTHARGLAVEYLTRQRALAAPEVQNDDDLKATGTKELAEAKDQLEKAVKRAYQHIAYLAQPDLDGERRLGQHTFDAEHSTSLDGTIVWKALAEREKVFDTGAFNGNALVHNLRDSDYGRTLSDLRAAFYSAPRLPLLFGGDPDLQQAIYDAVTKGTVDIIDGAGDPVAVTAPNQVNLTSVGLRLAKPKAVEASAGSGGGAPEESLASAAPSVPGGSGAGDGGGSPTPAPTQEQQVAFSFTKSLLGDDHPPTISPRCSRPSTRRSTSARSRTAKAHSS